MFISFVHLSSELEITQISINSRVDKNWGVYSYSGILHSKEVIADAYGNMSDLHKPWAAEARHKSQCHMIDSI